MLVPIVVALSMFGLLPELKLHALPLPDSPLFCTGDKHFLEKRNVKEPQRYSTEEELLPLK